MLFSFNSFNTIPVIKEACVLFLAMETKIRLNKRFGYTVAIALLLISCYHFLFRHKQDNIVALTGIILLIITYLNPLWLNPFRKVWDKVGHVMGIVNTYVLLTLFYCLILTPLSLIMRLFGKDILKLKTSGNLVTYWEFPVKSEESKMENQF